MLECKSNIDSLPFNKIIKCKLKWLLMQILESISDPKMIVLFGSYARMEQTISSDLDIFVLTTASVPRNTRGYLMALFEENNADIVFAEESIFSQSDCYLYREIRKDGVLLWKK